MRRSSGGFAEARRRILEEPIIKTMVWLAWPIILGNLVNISYNLVDAYWLGKLGRQAFGAPTVTWPLIFFFYSIGFGYAFAGISLISQYFGAGNKRMAGRSAGNLLSFMFMVAVLISVFGYVLSPVFLTWMSVPPDVYPLAVNYIRIIFVGIPFTFIGFAFNIIASSLGDTRTPTYIGIVTSILNMFLDPLLIFGWMGFPRLEVVGAAIATILSRTLSSVIGLYLLFHGFKGLKIHIGDLRMEAWWIRKIFHIGTPLAIQRSSTALGFTIMMSLVSMYGSAVIAAYGIAIRIIDIIQSFTWGFMRATSIMVGQNIGAELYERARLIANKSITLITTTLLLGGIPVFIYRQDLVSVFINDPLVIEQGSLLLAIFTWSIPFFGIFFVAGGIANGSGHTRAFAVISIIRLWVLRIGLSYLLALYLGMGPLGIWIGMTLSNIGAGLMGLAWIMKGTWLQRVIELPGQISRIAPAATATAE